jgi:formylglycine-generating enzyme required for sulfatase activity
MTNSVGIKLVLIPPGEFEMGSTPEEIARAMEEGKRQQVTDTYYFERVPTATPKHRVRISKAFYLGSYLVTQGEHEKVAGANPSAYSPKLMDGAAFEPPLAEVQRKERLAMSRSVAGMDTSRHPVEMLSWKVCTEFCQKLSATPAERAARRTYRLPTEAEWEYACRAGTTTRWYSGDDEARLLDYAWFEPSGPITHPVGQKRPNAFGLYDMNGNVWQWCSDWYGADYYQQSPLADPAGPATGQRRVLRGGDFARSSLRCLSAFRWAAHPTADRTHVFGFRLVCQIAGQQQQQAAENSAVGK